MTRRQQVIATVLLLAFLLAIVLLLIPQQVYAPTTNRPGHISEQPVTVIPLGAPLDSKDAEISGLAWYGETLIVLPQYPTFSDKEGQGALYAIRRGDILAFLDGKSKGPLQPIPIKLEAPGLAEKLDGYQGYESLAFDGDDVYLTIETEGAKGPLGYLVKGHIEPDLSALVVDTEHMTEIAPQSASGNKTEEAMTLVGDDLLTFYEVNGAVLNPKPMAHRFHPGDMRPTGTIPFPNIEYRITDATAADASNCFWAINYNFPGDTDLQTKDDPLVKQYGEGPTHAQSDKVERLLHLCLKSDRITVADPPIYMELLPGDTARNWEGLVQLEGRGFLVATDKFPETILGFVPMP